MDVVVRYLVDLDEDDELVSIKTAPGSVVGVIGASEVVPCTRDTADVDETADKVSKDADEPADEVSKDVDELADEVSKDIDEPADEVFKGVELVDDVVEPVPDVPKLQDAVCEPPGVT